VIATPARRRIVLLDDDARFRSALLGFLTEDSRVEVVASVGTVDSAVGAVTTLHPDVAIVDVQLGDGHGADATRMLRAACPDLRVFALSTFTDAGHRQEMHDAGAERYFVKGQMEADVLQALVAELDGAPGPDEGGGQESSGTV
jgi:DNA-binding NarL/FixJ family response regulator